MSTQVLTCVLVICVGLSSVIIGFELGDESGYYRGKSEVYSGMFDRNAALAEALQ